MLFAQIGFAQFRPGFLRLNLIDAGIDRDAGDPMLQRDLAGKLRQLLHDFDEDHLAKVFLGRSARPVRADDLRDQRIEMADQSTSGLIVIGERGFDEPTNIGFGHVGRYDSTP